MKKKLKALWKHSRIIFVSIVLSLGGIYVAAWLNAADHGGVGGAFAVAATFFLFFKDQKSSQDFFRKMYDRIPLDQRTTPQGLYEQIQLILARLNVAEDGQEMLNIALGCASIIGTVAWAIGDLGSKYLIQNHPSWLFQTAS